MFADQFSTFNKLLRKSLYINIECAVAMVQKIKYFSLEDDGQQEFDGNQIKFSPVY